MNPDTKPVFRVLLAEDVKLNQILTQKLLARSGYQIDVVENGRVPIERLRASAADAGRGVDVEQHPAAAARQNRLGSRPRTER